MKPNEIKLKFENNNLKQEIKTLKKKNETLQMVNKRIQKDVEGSIRKGIAGNEKYYESRISSLEQDVKAKEDMKTKVEKELAKERKLHIKDNNVHDARIAELEQRLEETEQQLAESKKENAKLKARLNTDGTNSSLPTSMTPLNKKKIIPNTRVKSGKSIGGQKGHTKHKLEKFNDDEINENIYEELDKCPCCGSNNLKELNNGITKDELDYEIKVIKKRHHFVEYECCDCHKLVRKNIPNNLKEDNQYGNKVKAHALALTNVANVPFNKTRRIISGLTCNEINLSEGFIAKLQKSASSKLSKFIEDLENYVVKLDTVYWDDTVIFINTKRSCLRFYGDSSCALYKAHDTKGKVGLDEDNILARITNSQYVVHDHNKVNYNNEYIYINVECCQHLERDLEKVKNNIPDSEWSIKLKELFASTKHKRDENIKNNVEHFTSEETNNFMIEFDELILQGIEENKKHGKSHYYTDEKALLNRLVEYRDNYTYWLYDYDIPYTNNESERSLRGIKTKMKVSGQFQNLEYAKYYANIRSYIETCKRNSINEYEALERLLDDNPYTIDEIFGTDKNEEK